MSDEIKDRLTKSVCWQRVIMAAFILIYAAYSAYQNDFYVIGKNSSGGAHFHGVAVFLLVVASICAAGALLAPVVGLYDKRANCIDYEKTRRYFAMVGYGLMSMGMFYSLFQPSLLPADGEFSAWLMRSGGWIICGLVVAQLGRLPAAYARKAVQPKMNAPLSMGSTYFGAALVAAVALVFFIFAAWVISMRPDLLLAFNLPSLVIWIPMLLCAVFTAWTVSIIQRGRKTQQINT